MRISLLPSPFISTLLKCIPVVPIYFIIRACDCLGLVNITDERIIYDCISIRLLKLDPDKVIPYFIRSHMVLLSESSI